MNQSCHKVHANYSRKDGRAPVLSQLVKLSTVLGEEPIVAVRCNRFQSKAGCQVQGGGAGMRSIRRRFCQHGSLNRPFVPVGWNAVGHPPKSTLNPPYVVTQILRRPFPSPCISAVQIACWSYPADIHSYSSSSASVPVLSLPESTGYLNSNLSAFSFTVIVLYVQSGLGGLVSALGSNHESVDEKQLVMADSSKDLIPEYRV
ncbi:hypothetical protein BDN72DRAFT_846023 [Pluteus cervinus]|uniref:Uncharacterized protein n=1 Tax=Pluteus cervinus TaxID=181527 RepID=A0ACD3AHN5_9AGAR|nr:hypothetical protein BDN72DRAFT_846023 [Pluteus cervinus]